mmetsp:Transcript_62613/g.135945  ORF Transcript_62613/g.135945 Transcript_62613/m.135945 type:complete len:101 (-) Transcript_62613:98-400(-)|eukprot:CAMPEP_0170578820 /NCGR_PEP_ID=MMETSP0224-20130122/5659_1 /TAXON_ID=285029 /ORGANISM="Togula jolla, Strain CCCM 725" /LENGTH=100 /DNA_ID=CAMNT_0010901813 /DNA_START=55 /DNA_END=357 /DNA_ORIENTATION=+
MAKAARLSMSHDSSSKIICSALCRSHRTPEITPSSSVFSKETTASDLAFEEDEETHDSELLFAFYEDSDFDSKDTLETDCDDTASSLRGLKLSDLFFFEE